MNNELQHHGIKGQKWGVRRYQNADGSLTPAGKKKYGTKENMEDRKKQTINNLSTGVKAAKALDDSARPGSEIAKRHGDKIRSKERIATENAVREHATKMTDQELRDAVNRLNMEENYTRMMANRAYIDSGRTMTEKFFDVAHTTLTLTSTALTIAMLAKQLKG